jgi:hypothetical protein
MGTTVVAAESVTVTENHARPSDDSTAEDAMASRVLAINASIAETFDGEQKLADLSTTTTSAVSWTNSLDAAAPGTAISRVKGMPFVTDDIPS